MRSGGKLLWVSWPNGSTYILCRASVSTTTGEMNGAFSDLTSPLFNWTMPASGVECVVLYLAVLQCLSSTNISPVQLDYACL